jgi:hypothetical protein
MLISILILAILAVVGFFWVRRAFRNKAERFEPTMIAPSPKRLASEGQGALLLDAVFVDDDPLVRQAWEFRAEGSGKTILLLSTVDELRQRIPALKKSTPIFLDSSLGNGIKGEEFAKELFEQGFKELYLSTGYAASQFAPMPWLKGIIGKEPPEWFFG